jgi:hypothetical protein
MYRDLGHNWNGHQISGKIHWKKSTSHRQKVRLPNSGITNLEKIDPSVLFCSMRKYASSGRVRIAVKETTDY